MVLARVSSGNHAGLIRNDVRNSADPVYGRRGSGRIYADEPEGVAVGYSVENSV